MSDIFNPPPLPDYTAVECPECGRLRGIPCSDTGPMTCNPRIWLVNMIADLAAMKQPEPMFSRDAPIDTYAGGWNDALDAIVERLRGGMR